MLNKFLEKKFISTKNATTKNLFIMKKIILLTGIVLALVTSCSTDDISAYEQNSNKTILAKEKNSDFCITCRDTINRDNDSIVIIDPVKPKKD